jgi:hypothetical protein
VKGAISSKVMSWLTAHRKKESQKAQASTSTVKEQRQQWRLSTFTETKETCVRSSHRLKMNNKTSFGLRLLCRRRFQMVGNAI